MNRLHLLCNAHLDPCWLWELEEGVAETLSTFRTAADFCEVYPGFIFNHNEVVLYKWIEENDPALFERIQRLVKEGKWHIMGGWCLQPDCNMPSGESFVRQILAGRLYFTEKFDVEPTTAINFDPFGHTRGLVQILAKSGYDSYIHCRPFQSTCELPDADYLWIGYDGSEIMGHRTLVWYGSASIGKIKSALENYIEEQADRPVGLVTWGVGNHGGGPSREDLRDITEIIEKNNAFPIIHSTPEAFFKEWRQEGHPRPRHEKDLNSWAPGCYTSQIRIKQKHRELENAMYMVEKMAANASMQEMIPYPKDKLYGAMHDLLLAEFHDILPGSSIQPCEDAGLRLMDHGLEILSRIRTQTFLAFASGQQKAAQGEIPVFAYNPHPFPIETVLECEFNLPSAVTDGTFTQINACANGKPIPCQVEQEASNLANDWRKKCVFHARLEPATMNRLDCTTEVLDSKPVPQLEALDNQIAFKTDRLDFIVNCETGLVDKYAVDGVDFIRSGAFRLIVIDDNDDPWGSRVLSFRDVEGEFSLMSPEKGQNFSGIGDACLPSVRVVEDGPVRSVVEALFSYGDSFAVLTYKLPRHGTEIELHVRVFWNEKSKMLKLAVPTSFDDGEYWGQVAYGRDILPGAEREVVAQKWTAAASATTGHALTVINSSTYGSDYVDNEIRLSLLRSAAYSSLPLGYGTLVPEGRFTPRIDQGERQYTFWINGGTMTERMDKIDREALVRNEQPMVLSFYPSGAGTLPETGAHLDDDVVLMTALKKSEGSDAYIVRLFEPTGTPRDTMLSIPALDVEHNVSLGAFEIKTFMIDVSSGFIVETDLIERPL